MTSNSNTRPITSTDQSLPIPPSISPYIHAPSQSIFQVCLFNVCSLVKKLNQLQFRVFSSDFSFLCFNKNWLANKIFGNEIIPSGYTLYHRCTASRRGGVMMALNDHIPGFLIPSPPDLEVVTIVINLPEPPNTKYCILPTQY